MLVSCRRALETLIQARRAEHDPDVARVPIAKVFIDRLNASVVDLDSGDIVEIEDGVLVTVHGEAHFSWCGRVVGQCPRNPGVEKMVGHDHEERRVADATLSRKGAGAVTPLPALDFDEVDRDTATPGDIGKMRPDPFGLMA